MSFQRAVLRCIRVTAFAAAGLFCASCATPSATEFDWGPIASRQRDARGSVSLKLAGPFFEHAVATNGDRLVAVRPFWSKLDEPGKRRRASETLWPLATARQVDDQFMRRIALSYYRDDDVTDPEGDWHTWVLPFYFQGRDRKTNDYWAVFPLGGEIHDFLWSDMIRFALFPIWSESRAGSARTDCWMWPIYARTTGPRDDRERVFPLWGYSDRSNDYERSFLLWPLWTQTKSLHERSSGGGFIFFPFYGRLDFADARTTYVIPPVFRFTRGERLNITHCPWPFFQHESGEIEKTYLWPLWGTKLMRGEERSFLLWPIFRSTALDNGFSVRRSFRATPILYTYQVREKYARGGGEPAIRERYTQWWPLTRYDRIEDDTRFRLFDLWPLRKTGPVEREYAPLWTLYSARRGAAGCDAEALWGTVRYKRHGTNRWYASLFPLFAWDREDGDEPRKEWTLFKGLLGWRREGSQSSLQLLYFIRVPLGRSNEP